MSEIKTIRLEAITTKIGSGATPRGGAEAYKESGITLIRSMNVYDSVFQGDGLAFIDDDQADGLSNVIVEPDDVLLNITGASVARCCLVPRSVLPARVNQHVAIVRADKAQADPRFVCYCLVSPRYKDELLSIAQGGATREALTKEKIQNFEIPDVPLPTQRKIASILSAYDDLIENNTRRIAILEEMAQAIYREWFVNFRFPGHENVKLVDSPLGQIPDRWEVRKLNDITTKIGSGATPRGGKKAYKESGMTLIRSLNVYDYNFQENGLAFIDDDQAAQLDNVAVEKHDILLNITGASVARCCMVPSHLLPARVNQHVAIIRTDKETADPFYVLTAINSERHKKHLLALAQGGATREALTKTTIQTFELALPDARTIAAFGEVVGSMFEQREILHRKNESLRTTRDLLLPKLISGKLDVEDLATDVGMIAEALEEATA